MQKFGSKQVYNRTSVLDFGLRLKLGLKINQPYDVMHWKCTASTIAKKCDGGKNLEITVKLLVCDWFGRIRLIITLAVCHLALTPFVNGQWLHLPSCLTGK